VCGMRQCLGRSSDARGDWVLSLERQPAFGILRDLVENIIECHERLPRSLVAGFGEALDQ
jgi:hypothetical protein